MRKLVFALITAFACSLQAQMDKVNGLSLVGAPDFLERSHLEPLLQTAPNHIAIMPFGFVRSLENPEIIYNTQRQWFGETLAGAAQYIDLLHEQDLKVMLKPQLWIWRGEYTGHLKMKTEEEWRVFEEAYRAFILDYARLAGEKEVAIFCIGTELEQFVVQRTAFWVKLIREIRSHYDGPLTYAANWDEYKRVPFWQLLDFVGVDAYFPISESKTPTVRQVIEGWQVWKQEMREVSAKEAKPILFTEYGYRSLDYAGKEPWLSDRDKDGVNLEAQANLLAGLYEAVWAEPWFAGGFLWKWFVQHPSVGGGDDNRFTPQNKPATMVIQFYYDPSWLVRR